jgi:hypothetical protein
MIPQRFVTEYPERCGQLLHMLEPHARERDLVGSFALLVASAAFTIPFARVIGKQHPTGKPEPGLFLAIEGFKKRLFLDAPFWNGMKPRFFRYAKILTSPEHAAGWRNAAGVHPINSTEKMGANTVLRTIRHALAHGNVVYLDERGHEVPGNRLRYLAFLKSWISWVQTFPPETELMLVEAAE